jgi:formate hydrogenlyase subunit 4
MTQNPIVVTLAALANVLTVLTIAPLCEGVLRKLTARIQSRHGPPIWQAYFDLLKLLGKEDIESGEFPAMQRFAALLSLTIVLAFACFVPLGFAAPLSGSGDVILIINLLTLSGICTALAGLAAGSTYSLVGVSRETMSMITLEPLFAIAILVAAVHTHSLRLDSVLNVSLYANGSLWSAVLTAGLILFALQGFVQRVPFDVAEAETELMDGPLMEYSGPKLGLFKYAQQIKLVIYTSLFVALFIPWGSTLPFPASWLLFWIKIAVLIAIVTIIAATHARYRIDQAIRYFATLLALACGALALAAYGL